MLCRAACDGHTRGFLWLISITESETTHETTRSHRSSNWSHRRHACNARRGHRAVASDFYLYTNPPGARLCDLCSRPHLLKQRGQSGVAMLITNTIADLRQQIHDDLRRQHPEWVLPNGESPMCDDYEARLMEELDTFTRRGSNESIAAPQRAFEQGTGR